VTEPSPRLGRAFLLLGSITWLLLVVGATVRVHSAGLACPDWPLCFGKIIPQLNFQIFLEWGHRLFASIISLGFLSLGYFCYKEPAIWQKIGRWYGVAVLVLGLQIVLGGLTVLKLLATWSVTSHLITGNLFFFLLVWIGHLLQPVSLFQSEAVSKQLKALGAVLALAVLAQMTLGGLVSSSGAGMACPQWPRCNDLWFPTWTGIAGLQIVHRLGAYTVFALSLGFLAVAWKSAMQQRALLIVGLVLAQVTLGISNVLLAMPVELAVLHSGTGDLLLLICLLNASSLWSHK
jgi:cytochrome c oxidase assembly protein subunit 15